jgi:Uma2 family endonuclease
MVGYMTAVLKRATFTADEYDRMLRNGHFAGKPRVELLEGVIYEMSPLHLPHARAQFVLTKALDAKLDGTPELAVVGSVSVRLSEHSVPDPDIVVYRRTAATGFVPLADAQIAIEISVSTLNFDLGHKRDLYAAAGLPEYWVVDVTAKTIHQHAAPAAGAYQTVRIVTFSDAVSALTLPGLDLGIVPFDI